MPFFDILCKKFHVSYTIQGLEQSLLVSICYY